VSDIVIAIDGPAGSGKSTTAREVARRLGYRYLDTGAMYRALALTCLRAGICLDDEDKVAEEAGRADIDFIWECEPARVTLDGADVSDAIRTRAVSDGSSRIAVHAEVRRRLVAKQRRIGAAGEVVVEGRDTTTVVFPDAALKVYMDADLDVRAGRRRLELAAAGVDCSLSGVKEDLRQRDRRDAGRAESPLSVASDAVRIDTSSMTVEEQVEAVIRKAREVLQGGSGK
jgi:cytidylate kinase